MPSLKEEVAEAVMEALEDLTGQDDISGSELIDRLDLDSLDLQELIMSVEEDLDTDIDFEFDDDTHDMTVRDLIHDLTRSVRRQRLVEEEDAEEDEYSFADED